MANGGYSGQGRPGGRRGASRGIFGVGDSRRSARVHDNAMPPKHFMASDVKAAIGENADKCENRSLWIDKFPGLPTTERDAKWRKDTIRHLVGMRADPIGIDVRKGIKKDIAETRELRAHLGGCLIVNQAVGVIENAGLCLDRHFGLPYIPGAAVKGITQAYAMETDAQWQRRFLVFGWSAGDKEARQCLADHEELLKESFAGTVAFMAAYPVKDARLDLDIVTCHHHDYYAGKQDKASDTESPIPNVFPVVESGAEFGFVLVPVGGGRGEAMKARLGLPDDFNSLAAAEEWLRNGICERGIGSKTAAGYGWFIYDADAELARQQKERDYAEALLRERREKARRDSLTPEQKAMEDLAGIDDGALAARISEIEKADEATQRAIVNLLKGPKFYLWKEWKKAKTYKTAKRRAILLKVAEELKETLP